METETTERWVEIPTMSIDTEALAACRTKPQAFAELDRQWAESMRSHNTEQFTTEQREHLDLVKDFLRDVIVMAFDKCGMLRIDDFKALN